MAAKLTSTQKYLPFREIKNNAVIMNDGSLRAVLLVSSVNFALKSDDEQDALVAGYVSFVNTIDFPIQIVIQSRRIKIEEYIERLKELEKKQTNELLRMQTIDYRNYISELVELGDIMSKKFFIVVQYSPIESKKKTFFERAQELFVPVTILSMQKEKFQKNLNELFSRVEQLRMGLNSMGINSAVLDTQSLIEFYYNLYNPKVSESQSMEDIKKLRVQGQVNNSNN